MVDMRGNGNGDKSFCNIGKILNVVFNYLMSFFKFFFKF